MAVGPDAEDGEIDAAAPGDRRFDARRLGGRIAGCGVERVNAILRYPERLKERAPQPGGKTPPVARADAGIFVEGDEAGPPKSAAPARCAATSSLKRPSGVSPVGRTSKAAGLVRICARTSRPPGG